MPIRESRDQHSFDSFPGLIAVFHALRRLLAPRHPPHALSSLAALILSSARDTATLRCQNRIQPTDPPPLGEELGRVTILSLSGSCRDSITANRRLAPPTCRCRDATLTATKLSKNFCAAIRPGPSGNPLPRSPLRVRCTGYLKGSPAFPSRRLPAVDRLIPSGFTASTEQESMHAFECSDSHPGAARWKMVALNLFYRNQLGEDYFTRRVLPCQPVSHKILKISSLRIILEMTGLEPVTSCLQSTRSPS